MDRLPRALRSKPRVNPDDLVRWRAALNAGDQLAASTVRWLIEEVEALWADPAR